ncbi:protein translocase subunit SecF [Roseomonas marmotae]|uniref:Protein-export membrane protein SecF n=1 Tax=Roseomonas marmotae TaxID=2768161 RepID=A0ABS3KDE7_9PROT|nr:protein translocase subunit SecF [Roseomonas marmotae]MBO1074361.1 protein translocase subunit SecF [Roseomonas marmotae]QTI78107.1 protein translocase subunit SecF [Roseomonas marmotae]
MFLARPLFRLVPDNTHIPFMKGRKIGIAISILLSIASIILGFYPGLEKGIDFRGGIVMEVRTPSPANIGELRNATGRLGLGDVGLQEFGDASTVLIRLPVQGDEAATQDAVIKVRNALESVSPGARILRTEAVGNRVSGELFTGSLIALGISMLAMMIYIWVRFEWQFAVGAIVTLLLETTKVVGFLAITRIEFNLTTVAAVLTIIGFSVNDKVVVYDRMRENLRKYKTMPLRDLIDRSINETLNRTLGTSMTLLLSAVPLALFGGDALSGFAITMVFGIIASTSSSIFIAAPMLLFLGDNRLRRSADPVKAPAAAPR